MSTLEVTSIVFRAWVKLHRPPLRLSQLRLLWRETRRFVLSQERT